MKDELFEKCKKYAKHIEGLCQVPCFIMDTHSQSIEYKDFIFCDICKNDKCQMKNAHLYGCSEAYRWDGRYIYYCPLALVFVAACVYGENGEMSAGLVCGPIVMDNADDFLSAPELFQYRESFEKISVFSTKRVNDLAELMYSTALYLSDSPQSSLKAQVYSQEKLLNTLYEQAEKLEQDTRVLIDGENRLEQLIKSKDKAGAQQLLNEILGQIYFSSAYDVELIKARLLELIVLMSRATIDAGADINEILQFNTNYIKEIEKISNIEELSAWITQIMHRFINYTFDFTQIKHSNTVYKVMDFVKRNYDRKLTLEEISSKVFLSRTYLSKIFKEETNQTLSNYINSVRIEKSKQLLKDSSISLIDIAGLCGFEDQSYFTKVFTKEVGISPKKYRDTKIKKIK
ncbi:MAG: AraC family transcriptional regulator [Ruminococcaceae bacterium]|nr:AraC family transcriptional regulator [Oscillospiraceae bacterium]